MTEAGEKNANWAQAWIDEQREKLNGASSEEGQRSDERDFAALWSQLGSDWWSGYEKLVRASFPGLSIPFGWARAQEQEWQDLAVARAEYRRLEAELLAQLVTIHAKALDRLEHAVRARATDSQPIAGIRELYDLWIECGEHVYAEAARSDEYCRLQAALGNASVQLRARQQKVLERGLKYFDLPTRAELNSVHRELRAVREQLAELAAPQPRRSHPPKSATRAKRVARTRAPKRSRT